jgi:hypothetical protein
MHIHIFIFLVISYESSVVRRKLNRHKLKEGVDFKVDTSVDLSSSTKQTRNIYYLTPNAFKKCLIKTKRHPSQTIDPEIGLRLLMLITTKMLLFLAISYNTKLIVIYQKVSILLITAETIQNYQE